MSLSALPRNEDPADLSPSTLVAFDETFEESGNHDSLDPADISSSILVALDETFEESGNHDDSDPADLSFSTLEEFNEPFEIQEISESDRLSQSILDALDKPFIPSLVPSDPISPSDHSNCSQDSEDKNCCFCETKTKQLARHLGSADDCKMKFCQKFNLPPDSEISKILAARRNERKKFHPSRQPDRRLLETRKQKLRISNTHDINLYNNYLKNINQTKHVFVCCKCNHAFRREDVQPTDIVESVERVLIKDNSLWVCPECVSEDGCLKPPTDFFENVILVNAEGREIFIPSEIENDNRSQKSIDKLYFLLPSSVSACGKVASSRDPIYRKDLIKAIHSDLGYLNINALFSPMYEHKLKQLLDASRNSSCYTGRIIDLDDRKVKIIDSIKNTSKVKGSDDYYAALNTEAKFALFNLGSTFLVITLRLEKNTESLWAKIIQQLNEVKLELQEEKDDHGILKIHHFVHESHNSESECNESCDPIDISKYLERCSVSDLSRSLIAACSGHIYDRFNQLITLANSMQNLRSDRFFAMPQFPINQESAQVSMMSWPTFLSTLNRKLANNEKITEADIFEMSSHVDKIMTTSLDAAFVSRQFDFSVSTSLDIIKLAKDHQYHNHGGIQCPDCVPLFFPSNITFVCQEAKSGINNSLKSLKNAFKEELMKLPEEFFSQDATVTLDDFFEMLRRTEFYSLKMVDSVLVLKLSSHQEFEIKTDEMFWILLHKFRNNMLSALYHRAISFSSGEGLEIVLQRPLLRDCFVVAYNPMILLAVKSRVVIKICGKEQKKEANEITIPIRDLPEDLIQFSADHIMVTSEEAIFLTDPKKKLVKRNTKTLFINTIEDKKLKFGNPLMSDPRKNYINIDNGKELKKIGDMHDYYLERPGLEKLVLDQFLSWYTDGNDGEEQGCDVETRQLPLLVTSIDSPDAPPSLPKTLVLQSGKRLKLRTIPRIVSYQTPERDTVDFVKLSIILFHPHRTYEEVHELTTKQMTDIYNEKETHPKKNGAGKEMTKIETVRAILHPEMNMEIWDQLFN